MLKLHSPALPALVALFAMSSACPETAEEVCGNGLDDDDNGKADCDDAACAERTECQVVGECLVDVNFPRREPSSATPLALSTPVTGTLCPARDDDGYRVTVPAPSSVILVTLSMETYITPLFLGYSISRADGTPLGIFFQDPDTSAGHVANFTGFHRVEEAGDYTIIVADVEARDDGFDNVNPYTLTVEVVPDPDANEPNNTTEQATPIVPGDTDGIIATSGDVDWYSIAVDGPARIIDAVVTAPAESGIEHVATLFAPDGITVLQTVQLTAGDVPGQESARIRKAVSGSVSEPFLLSVADGGSDGTLDAVLDPAIAGYTITLAVIPDPDGNEGAGGNELLETATSVASGQTLNAALAAFADRDTYRIVPPGGTSVTAPRVLLVEVNFDGVLDATFKPQVQVVGVDPEDENPPACASGCPLCIGNDTCGEVRLQRFAQKRPFRTAYPLRDERPVFVTVNEFNDDAAQLTGGYTIRFEIVADPDAGEQGDDYLITNLENAGFANEGELDEQRDRSKARARQVSLGYQPVCPENAPADGCLDLVPVAHPVENGFDSLTVSCAEAGTVTRTMSGRLTYEGDRDYFLFPDFPSRGYFGIEVEYSIDRATPVELALFVHGDNGGALAGSTLEATDEGSCREEQGGQNACAPGTICVDATCWSEGDDNPARVTPPVVFGDDECVVAGPIGFERPVYLEVVDNGINDFDLDMTYTLRVTVRCGCPQVCDNGLDFCQDG